MSGTGQTSSGNFQNVPLPSSQWVDPKTGFPTIPFFQFCYALWSRTGGIAAGGGSGGGPITPPVTQAQLDQVRALAENAQTLGLGYLLNGLESDAVAQAAAQIPPPDIFLSSLIASGWADVPPYVPKSLPGLGLLPQGWTRPSLTALNWVNQGSATGVDHGADGPLTIIAPSAATPDIVALTTPVPAAPWTLSTLLSRQSLQDTIPGVGLVLRASGTGRVVFFGTTPVGQTPALLLEPGDKSLLYATDTMALVVGRYGSPTAFSSNVALAAYGTDNSFWLRITNDGTDFSYWFSIDGLDWSEFFSEPIAAWGTITDIGFGLNAQDASASPIMAKLWNWTLL